MRLKPENTLPSFEIALDWGVTTLETDLHLSADGVPILCHDPSMGTSLFRRSSESTAPEPAVGSFVHALTVSELRGYRADRNPDPVGFPEQDANVTPLAEWFAAERSLDPFGPPTLADLFDFVAAYGA